ncbi:MAG: PLDc N-terminal domain-containing protein [Rhodospirillales bacterium]
MGIEVGFLGLIILALDIWAILNVVQSGASMGGKIIWILLVLVFPILGFVIWLFVGPRGVKG